MSPLKWKKSPPERWIKLKVKGKWRKFPAPALEKNIEIWLLIMKKLLKSFDFKIEEKDEKTIPKSLLDMGIKEETFALPTKSLIGHSSSIYPGRRIKCIYYGNSWFWITSDYQDGFGKFLTREITKLYTAAATEYLQTRDVSVVEKKFREYYELPKPEKEITKEPKVEEEIVQPPEVKIEKEPKLQLELPPLPEEAEIPPEIEEEIEAPPEIPEEKTKEEEILPPMDKIITKVDEFEPKDSLGQMAKVRFDAVLDLLSEEELKDKLYQAFYPVTVDSSRSNWRDFFRKAGSIEARQKSQWREKWRKQKKPFRSFN